MVQGFLLSMIGEDSAVVGPLGALRVRAASSGSMVQGSVRSGLQVQKGKTGGRILNSNPYRNP